MWIEYPVSSYSSLFYFFSHVSSLYLFDHSYTLPREDQKDETLLLEDLKTGNTSQHKSTQVNTSQHKINTSQQKSTEVQ